MGFINYKSLIIFNVVPKADGFHYRQPWVIGEQEEIERLTKRVVEAEDVTRGMSKVTKQIETLEVSELSLLFHSSYMFDFSYVLL